MRIIPLALFVAAALLPTTLCAQTPRWTNAFSIGAAGTETPTGIGADAARNVYLTSYNRVFDVPDPPSQILASWAPDGTARWTRTILSGAASSQASMSVDASGNVYIALTFSGDTARVDHGGDTLLDVPAAPGTTLIFMKYDATGELQWFHTSSCTDTVTIDGVAATPGGVWIAGTFNDSMAIGGTTLGSVGASDVFVTYIGGNSTYGRVMRAGGPGADICDDIAAHPDGGAVVTGRFSGTARFGEQSLSSNGTMNMFLVRYSSNGAATWARSDGGAAFAAAEIYAPTVMAVDRNGNSYVGLSYAGTVQIADLTINSVEEGDGLLVKYNADGMAQWAFPMGGALLQLVQGVACDLDANVYVGGYSQSLPEGSAFVVKLTPSGNRSWLQTNGAGDVMGAAEGGPICADAARNLIIAGNFSGQVRFGSRLLTSVGSTPTSTEGSDIYVATIGSTSGIAPEAHNADGVQDLFECVVRDGMIRIAPIGGATAPTVLDAGLYSINGARISAPAVESFEGSVRFDARALPSGPYLVVLRTARGNASYPVVIAR